MVFSLSVADFIAMVLDLVFAAAAVAIVELGLYLAVAVEHLKFKVVSIEL
jgi:hypothetical protein